MQITGLTKEKAEKLFNAVTADLDDGSDDELCSYDIIEVIKMEHKVKESGSDKQYVKSDKPKTKAKREVKLDDEKVQFLESVKIFLEDMELSESIQGVTVVNPQKEIAFQIGGNAYSLNLVKHRPPKK